MYKCTKWYKVIQSVESVQISTFRLPCLFLLSGCWTLACSVCHAKWPPFTHSPEWACGSLRQVVTKRQKGGFDRSWNVIEDGNSHISSPSSPPSEPSEPLCHWNWSWRSHCKEQNWKDYVQMFVFRYVTWHVVRCDRTWQNWDGPKYDVLRVTIRQAPSPSRFQVVQLGSTLCSWNRCSRCAPRTSFAMFATFATFRRVQDGLCEPLDFRWSRRDRALIRHRVEA